MAFSLTKTTNIYLTSLIIYNRVVKKPIFVKMALDSTTLKLASTLGILVLGYIAARVGGSLIIALSKKKETIHVEAYTDFSLP